MREVTALEGPCSEYFENPDEGKEGIRAGRFLFLSWIVSHLTWKSTVEYLLSLRPPELSR